MRGGLEALTAGICQMAKRLQRFNRPWGANWLQWGALSATLPKWAGYGEVVLDLGCGESPFRGFFRDARIYLRMDRIMWDREVIQADALYLPLRDSSIDVVLLVQVLGDLPDLTRVFREIARVIKPGGRAIVIETMAYPEHDLPHDYYRLMPEGLKYQAARAGFHCEEVISMGGLFARFTMLWNCFIMSRLAAVRVLRPLMYLGTLTANCAAWILDRLMPHPALAPDYLALLVRNDRQIETTN